MVTTLAHTHHGRQYLAQQGVIDKISNIIIGADSDPLSGFYLPGDIAFLFFMVYFEFNFSVVCVIFSQEHAGEHGRLTREAQVVRDILVSFVFIPLFKLSPCIFIFSDGRQ